MHILLDHGTPAPLRYFSKGHIVVAIVVLGNAQWPVLRRHVERVVAAVNAATPGSYTEVEIPFE
jgi:hypothetical protein